MDPIKEVDVFTWLPGTVGLLGHDTAPYYISKINITNQDHWSHYMTDQKYLIIIAKFLRE